MIDTLAFDPSPAEVTETGWVSRYSFAPDWMIGMNSTLYSFKNGDIFKHDSTGVPRAQFYGVKYPASITTELNESQSDKKLFKTLHLYGSDSWDVTLNTDLMSGGMSKSSFERKEGDWYAYIRRLDSTTITPEDATLISTQGVGVVGTFASPQITFTTGIDQSAISSGDRVYKITNLGAFVLLGTIDSSTNISITLAGVVASTSPADFIVVGKNKVAESFGLRGYYLSVTLTNNSNSEVELFAVESEVFKSYP